MKIRPHRLFLASLVLTLAGAAHAATVQWVGDTDANFANAANWETDPDLPNSSSDTWQINTEGDFGTTLTVDSDPLTEGNQALAFTGTAGKIVFGTSAPAMTLTGGGISFVNSTGDSVLLGSGSTVTQTVQNNLVMGDGANSTMSITNQSITGGLLKVTGNITGGTGAVTLGNLTISLGSTTTNNGNYEITGNLTKGGANNLNITKRGSGILTLSGTNQALSLGQNEAGSTIVINGGKTSILNGVQTGWGGNQVSSLIKITGGELYANEAYQIRSKLEIDGGKLTVGSALTESGLTFNNHVSMTGEVLTIKSGTLDYAASKNGGYLRGFILATGQASSSISGAQTGGDFLVNGRSVAGQVFTLGNSTTTGTTTGYSLSGGLLDIKGQTGILGFLQINAEATGTSTTTFALSGTGKLISRFNPGATSGGIVGGVANANAVQVLALQGGTLVAGRIDATNLRGPNLGDTAGTIVNNGSTIAPGDIGSSGKTTVSGNLTINTGSLAFDIGGTAAATTWQIAAGSGKHDKLAATGTGVVVLGGALKVSLIDSFVPNNADSFYILDAPGGVSGTFTNLTDDRIILAGGDSFAVTIDGTSVLLSDYQPVGGRHDYTSWATANNVTGGPEGDSDNDGVKNLVEYALADGAERGTLSGNTLTFTKRGAPYGGDLAYIIEVSTSMEAGSWSPTVTHGPAQLGSPIAYTFTPGPGTAMEFARLKLTQP